MHVHSTPLTTLPTSFDKYANSLIISFRFSFLFSRSIAFHFLGGTLPGKWLIHSLARGAYSQSREGCYRPHQCLWNNCAPPQCAPAHCQQRRRPSLLECVKVACYLPTSSRIWACPVLQFQQSSQSGSSPAA